MKFSLCHLNPESIGNESRKISEDKDFLQKKNSKKVNLTQKLRNFEMADRRGSIPDKGSFLQHCLGQPQCFEYTKKDQIYS